MDYPPLGHFCHEQHHLCHSRIQRQPGPGAPPTVLQQFSLSVPLASRETLTPMEEPERCLGDKNAKADLPILGDPLLRTHKRNPGHSGGHRTIRRQTHGIPLTAPESVLVVPIPLAFIQLQSSGYRVRIYQENHAFHVSYLFHHLGSFRWAPP